MNAQRRKEIEEVLNELADLRSRIDGLHGEEQDAYDNMPEGLKASERGQASEAAASALDDALTAFDDIESSLNDAMA
ncbi:hypothetical protein KDK82_5949 [Delftia sp. K82]|uniref:hypothetical protein n=1 Tax=Delftia TaxID=80865 RepID=UPI000B706F52|nr:hypothetical protein [Delftia sp. K82]OWG12522.1 hypothetical protein KDK82_5949 [Delftia sp. K82]